MKLKSLFIAALALTCLAGNAWADTNKLKAEDGWTKITSVPTAAEIANNYYVFVDATRDLMLGVGKGVNQNTKWYSLGVFYQSSVEPTSAEINGKTWTLDTYGSGFALRNLEYSVSPFQTEWNAAQKFDTNDVYATANEWTEVRFTLADGVFTLQNGKYPDSGYIGPWTDENFTNGAECAANKTGNNVGKFYIYAISRNQFRQNLLNNASESNPVDLTPWYVTNATFDANNRSGWTEEGAGGNNNTTLGCEIWHRSNFNIYQDLTVPNGKYKVSLQIAGTSGAGSVYGTSGSTTKTATSSAAAGSDFQNTVLSMIQDRTFGQVKTDEIAVSNGALKIGMKCETTDQWLVFDNFKIYCTGVDLSGYVDQLAGVVSDANTFIESNAVPNACETAIGNAIAQYDKTYDTGKEYSQAILALSSVLDTYRNDTELQNTYAAFKAFKTNVEGLKTGVDDGDTKTALTNAISTAESNVEEATSASDINAQKANLRTSALTFISSTDGHFDITFLASKSSSEWKKKDGSTAGEVTWAVTNRGDWTFAESYESTCATTGNVLYQTVDNLPSGYYQVGMYAMAAYTPNRGFATEATEGDANHTFAFAGKSGDASSILRTGIAIPFKTTFDFSELTTLDVNVHMVSDGSLIFGIQKDANGSNWHFAQIASIVYSNQPDLTKLKATRDALVSEAEGLLNGSVEYLTAAQQTALQEAITAGNAANDFENLNTVTLTTLPEAINTAKQQVQLVKDNRVLMLAALERFENDYNLADGTDYRRQTMSAEAWTTLIEKVNAVSTALDDISQATSYGTLKDALVSQMDATDASLRLFKSYKAMVDGTTNLGIVGSYGSDGNMATDASQQVAIAALNTAFADYAKMKDDDFAVSAFLGSNLEFSAAEGAALNTDNSNNINAVEGWTVEYADADTWAIIQTKQTENKDKLYIRKNWGSSATTLQASKEKMLPVGKYRLSYSWNSNLENMTNLSAYVIGSKLTSIGEATTETQTLTYDFEITESAQPFDLTFGFKKTGTGNTPAQIVVDDISLTYLRPAEDLLARDYDPEALWFDATDSKYAAAKNVEVTPTAQNQVIKAAAADQFKGLTKNVIVEGDCANFVITDGAPLRIEEAFTATSATYTRTMTNDWGTIILPFALNSDENIQFYSLKASNETDMTFERESTIQTNTPVAFRKLSGDDGITVTATDVAVSPTTGSHNDNTTATFWSAEGSYTAQSIDAFESIYYIASNQFWAADGTMTVNPFRAIFRYSGSNPVKSFSINVDEANAIEQIADGESSNGKWYDLSGRPVDAPLHRGIYLRNGIKVVIR